ncbi:MAG: 5-(carboxyamino)imidazole ribonucleotide mutase [Planctomycetes bacterium]|nr:5-(carboxyamino)imidazole ribonucleotide mutase [Planctomycetota bacterium]
MAAARVAIVMGSDSDLELLRPGAELLAEFGVGCEVRVLSAHRSPEAAREFARGAAAAGLRVIIAAAGGAAHLAGNLAAQTTLPVLGVPIPGGIFGGLDALLATVQMPAGVPVGTLAVGPAGGRNAALLAVAILALSDADLAAKLTAYRVRLAEEVAAKDERVRAQFANLVDR